MMLGKLSTTELPTGLPQSNNTAFPRRLSVLVTSLLLDAVLADLQNTHYTAMTTISDDRL